MERGHILDATALVRTDFHFGTGLVIPWHGGCQAAAYRENEPVYILLHMFQKFAELGFQMSGSSSLHGYSSFRISCQVSFGFI